MEQKFYETEFGYFNSNYEYVIKTPFTPKPWINVISNGKYGLTISQTGSGFSFFENSKLNSLTRWFQDIIRDEWGKYIYIKDLKNNLLFSPTYQPTKQNFHSYQVKHSFGFSQFLTQINDLKFDLKIFIPSNLNLEIWNLKISNEKNEDRELEIYTYFEFCLNISDDNHREFYKTFIETEFKNEVILAKNRLWNIKNKKGEYLNRDWEFIAYHFSSITPTSFTTEKEEVIGQYGSITNPIFNLKNTTGKWLDPVGCLKVNLFLKSNETKEINFVLGIDEKEKNIYKIKKYLSEQSNIEKEFESCKNFWKNFFDKIQVITPDDSINLLLNRWLIYQAISCRLFARAAYYQQSGAYGFRDQLQDSQIFLPINPFLTKKQIRLHTEHQFSDGTVFHWWHPISEEGPKSNHSDDLLWLPFIVYRYLLETADFKFLNEKIKYFDKGKDSLYNHCLKTFEVISKRMSKRFLPLILGGDWNDGLSAVGTKGKGESIWLAFFVYYVIEKWLEIFRIKKDKKNFEKWSNFLKKLKNSIMKYGWDGEYFIRATKDNGKKIGSKSCKEGKIFLNPQIWSVISSAVDKEYQLIAMNSVRKELDREFGSLLFYPAYKKPDPEIGYLTRYAPGVRENGGVYFHAAVWNIWANLILENKDYAYQLLKRISPVLNSFKNPKLYSAEPYVTCGNIDGPDSPFFGKASWNFYTGSAAWLFTVILNEMIGIKPEFKGLRIEPKIPSEWKEVYVKRNFRNSIYEIRIINQGKAKEIEKILVDGKEVGSNILQFKKRKTYKVEVYLK